MAISVAAIAVPVAACGSKPSYCGKVDNLESSIEGLSNVNVQKNGRGAAKSQVQKIQSDVNAVVSSAKSDFPSQTSALSSSYDKFKASLSKLPSNQNAKQIATVTSDGAALVSAVKSLKDATNSNC